jgi:hypothetical protein
MDFKKWQLSFFDKAGKLLVFNTNGGGIMGKKVAVEAVVVKQKGNSDIYEQPEGVAKIKHVYLEDYDLIANFPDGLQLPPSTSCFPLDGINSTHHIKHENGIYKKK